MVAIEAWISLLLLPLIGTTTLRTYKAGVLAYKTALWQGRAYNQHSGRFIQYLHNSEIELNLNIAIRAMRSEWIFVKDDFGKDASLQGRLINKKTPSIVVFLHCEFKAGSNKITYFWSGNPHAMNSNTSAEWEAMEKLIYIAEQLISKAELKASASAFTRIGTRYYKNLTFSKVVSATRGILGQPLELLDAQHVVQSSISGSPLEFPYDDCIATDILVNQIEKFRLRIYCYKHNIDGRDTYELSMDWRFQTPPTMKSWQTVNSLFRRLDQELTSSGEVPFFPSPHYPKVVLLGTFAGTNIDVSCARLLEELQGHYSVDRHCSIGNRKIVAEKPYKKKVPGTVELEIESARTSRFFPKVELCIQPIALPPKAGTIFMAWNCQTPAELSNKDSFVSFMTETIQKRFENILIEDGAVRISPPKLNLVPKGTTAKKPTGPAAPVQASSRTTWPTPQDYNEALQTPSICFSDPELQTAEIALNHLGLPKVASGAFACVYKARTGANYWAVRCFITPIKDQLVRYEKTSRFVLSDDLPYTVPCQFLEKGIRINGSWFPIVKMEWVEGTPLNDYIAGIIDSADELSLLRKKFAQMMKDLQRNGIAHGDLQHGNVLIRNDEFFLVDYDNMYVPELAGYPSWEKGHRNYQHPYRSAAHFGPYLDNFSAWVIDTAFLSLQYSPELWHRYGAGDERLLFSARDFLDTGESNLFQFLLKHQAEQVRHRARMLESFLMVDLKDVPSLS